jgi:alkylation response protein AidB-like acyl-CoA dehydrogenase
MNVQTQTISRSGGEMDNPYLVRMRELRGLLTREAAVTESGGTLSPKVVEAFRDAEIFWMGVPRELGGGGASVTALMEVIEEACFADGSIGWSLMANLGATTIASAYLGDAAIERMYGGGAKPIMAGMLGPGGRSLQVAGGYRGAGKFGFGSGMGHADWVAAGMFVMDDGKPRTLASGAPEVRVCWLARDQIEILGNWNVSGLIGTGSFDYAVSEQFVPDDYTFERTSLEPRRGGPLYSLGLAAVGAAGHAAVVLGLARRALVEIVGIVDGKKRPGYPGPVGDHALFRHQFAIHEAMFQAGRDYVYRAFRTAEETASAGETVTQEQRARLRQSTTWLHSVTSEVVRFCHLWSGSEAIRSATVMNRISRDMAVATQHVFVDPITLIDAAPSIMASWRDEV